MVARLQHTQHALTAGAAGLPATPGEGTGGKVVPYQVVHQVDGRLRLRIPRLAYDAKFARRLTESVAALPGITHVRVNTTSASLVVHHQHRPTDPRRNGPSPGAGSAILPELIDAMCAAAGADVARDLAPAPAVASGDHINYLQQLGLPVLGIGLSAALLAGLALPPALVGATVLAATTPHILRGLRGLREEKLLTVEWLDVASVVLLLSQGSFLAPAFMMSVIEGAEIVRSWTARRSKQAHLDLLLSAPSQQALVERDGQEQLLALAHIMPGDIILVYPGDEIPADGTVLDGSASLNEHQVSGDPAPVRCERGHAVRAWTRVVEGHLRILAERTGHDTYAASVLALLAAAPKADTRVSNYAHKTGNWSVVPTFVVAGAVGLTSGSVGRATGIAAMDMGTGMRVSSPVAILAAQTYAARHGILIRSGRALEMLAQADVILIDVACINAPGGASAGVIAALGHMDKALFIVGSSRSGAAGVAATCGVAPEQVRAEVLPEQKVDFVKELQAGGSIVAVIGDGIGTAAAMAYADVSISLGNAGTLARETADIVLLNADLHDLVVAIDIARHTMQLVRQNQALVVTASTGAIAYATLAVLNPLAGVLLNNGVAFLAALNSLRALTWQGQGVKSSEIIRSPEQPDHQRKSDR